MGNVGPNDWSSNQIIFRTDLVTHEDKTTNHTNLVRTQTCVILVKHNAHSVDWFITKLAQQQEPQTPTTPSLMMTINNGASTQNNEQLAFPQQRPSSCPSTTTSYHTLWMNWTSAPLVNCYSCSLSVNEPLHAQNPMTANTAQKITMVTKTHQSHHHST